MSSFIIEYELEKVKNKQTKEYLEEVISSYNNGNYRSAIVVLYSIVIYDLLGKLKKLKDYYDDEVSKKIIDKVKEKQKKKDSVEKIENKKKNGNDKINNWEIFLLAELKDKTELLEEYEYEEIVRLRKDRNNYAHPLYNNDYKLIIPNKEKTRAHIRNMFEIVFLKDPLLSKEIIIYMSDDMEEYYSRVSDIEKFKTYLKSKYLNHFGESVKKIYLEQCGDLYLYQKILIVIKIED